MQTGAGTVQRAQQSASDFEAKRAALFSAQDTRNVALRQIDVIQAQRKSAEAQKAAGEAQKATAEANLSRTELRAPVDGRVNPPHWGGGPTRDSRRRLDDPGPARHLGDR